MCCEPPNVTFVVDRLEERGLVVRGPCPATAAPSRSRSPPTAWPCVPSCSPSSPRTRRCAASATPTGARSAPCWPAPWPNPIPRRRTPRTSPGGPNDGLCPGPGSLRRATLT
ncbi:hypothetical protein ACU686_02970 [Yinghuangia aomiensis]